MPRSRHNQDPTRITDVLPELRDALAAAQTHRHERAATTSKGEPEWVVYEREVMVDATTALLIRHALPINARDIRTAVEHAEQRANGHYDYTTQWALGCAEYITGLATAKATPAGA